MAAITLGFAEVEERLARVRRRLNTRALAHAAAVAGSAVMLVAAVLVVLEFRLSAAAYAGVAWSGVLLATGIATAAAIAARRRWLDTEHAAFVADRHGQLADRLTTVVGSLASRPDSRLLPTVLAQTLILGDRWQPEVVAPSRLPRSLWCFAAALLLLVSTPLLVPQPPPAATTAIQPTAEMLRSAGTSSSQPDSQDVVALTDEDAGDSPGSAPEAAPRSVVAANAAQTAGGSRVERDAPGTGSERSLMQFGERLRQSLARPFRQDPGPRQRAGKDAPLAGVGRIPEAANAPGRAEADAAQPRPGNAQAGKPATRQENAEAGSTTGRQPPPGRAGSAAKPRRERSETSQPPNAPPAPGAGAGSSPESLLAAQGSLPPADAPRAFKLTLTSFLQGIEQQDPPSRPAERRQTIGGPRGTGGERSAVPLSETQLANDPIRKAAIPGEYEDLIRRVYSQRPQP